MYTPVLRPVCNVGKNRQQGGIDRNRTHSFAIYSITISVPNVSIWNLNCICNPVSVILLVAL